ncbi:hypothetical protein B296_00045774 [Ensete ventricosum]|uniref:Uncharacterized protein n=1 Tax=Ensete ventricosum TaxID=4639 RepID=A0A426X0G1_ENSVE|nr:hypothetical protein B296_00045774 [Ensete ventricosum]
MWSASVSAEQALLVQARVRQLARSRLDAELELGSGEKGPESGWRGRLLELWVSGAFIATVMRYPYLNPLSSLLLTIPLLLTTSSVVRTTRRALTAEGYRPCPPYLC